MSENYWALLKTSDGERGERGKQKIYEVRVAGGRVTLTWGMAEKTQRQSKVTYYGNDNVAYAAAVNQVRAKVASGYRVAVSA